jgi:hypothetical protein
VTLMRQAIRWLAYKDNLRIGSLLRLRKIRDINEASNKN